MAGEHLPTRPRASAPEMLSYRRALYERDPLPPNEPWNPAARLAQMRENYDRLVLQLGVSPRGGARGGVVDPSVRLPRVPAGRHWPAAGSQSARTRVSGQYARGKAGSSAFEPLATARMLQKVDAMAEAGQLSAGEAKKMRKLWSLQDQLLTKMIRRDSGGDGGEEEALIAAMHSVVGFLDDPDASLRADAAAAPLSEDLPLPPSFAASTPATNAAARVMAAESGGNAANADLRDGDTLAGAGGCEADIVPPPPPVAAALSLLGASAPPPPAVESDPEADTAFAKVETQVLKSYARVFDFFRRMDADGDGHISQDELYEGFYDLGMELPRDEIVAFFRKVEPSGAKTTSLKQLRKVFRTQSTRHLWATKSAEEAAAEANQPITSAEFTPEGMSEHEVERARAEANLRAGRLPSLSPDEDEDASGGRKKASKSGGGGGGGGDDYDYVWHQLQSRLAPDGTAAAPLWQKETLERVHWRVDVKRREQRREHKQLQQLLHPQVPSWDRPARPSKRNLIDRELRKQQNNDPPPVASTPCAALGGARTLEEAPNGAFGAHGASLLGCIGTSDMGGAIDEPLTLAGFVPENASKRALEQADPEDTSAQQLNFLRKAAADHDLHTTERANKLAEFEQSLQQLVLQRQELDERLESTKRDIDKSQRSGRAASMVCHVRKEKMRRDRLQEDLQEVQSKANDMHTKTHALMHVINSLRITRKRHVQRVHGLEAKEGTMDNDAQFLLGSASAAMEERERLRSKHERLKLEAAAWRSMQLREAAALDEQLELLSAEHRELDDKLQQLEERDVRQEYALQKFGREDKDKRERRLGYLRGQVAGWAAEFERVTAITGVKFGDGKSDAVDKVVSIFSANELRNKSLFQYVTEDVVLQTETLEAELGAELALVAKLEAEQATADAAHAASATSTMVAVEALAVFEKQLEHMSRAVDTVIPNVEMIGMAVDLQLPQHISEKLPLAPPSVPEFLAIFEDKLHVILNTARHVVNRRAPLDPGTDENGRPKTPPPEPTPSDTLLILRSLVHRKTLTSGKSNALMHKDSSERLLPM